MRVLHGTELAAEPTMSRSRAAQQSSKGKEKEATQKYQLSKENKKEKLLQEVWR